MSVAIGIVAGLCYGLLVGYVIVLEDKKLERKGLNNAISSTITASASGLLLGMLHYAAISVVGVKALLIYLAAFGIAVAAYLLYTFTGIYK